MVRFRTLISLCEREEQQERLSETTCLQERGGRWRSGFRVAHLIWARRRRETTVWCFRLFDHKSAAAAALPDERRRGFVFTLLWLVVHAQLFIILFL